MPAPDRAVWRHHSRSRCLGDYTIDMHEFEFSEATGTADAEGRGACVAPDAIDPQRPNGGLFCCDANAGGIPTTMC